MFRISIGLIRSHACNAHYHPTTMFSVPAPTTIMAVACGIAMLAVSQPQCRAQTVPRPAYPISLPVNEATGLLEPPIAAPESVAHVPYGLPQEIQGTLPCVPEMYSRGSQAGNPNCPPSSSAACDQFGPPVTPGRPTSICPPPKKNIHHVFIPASPQRSPQPDAMQPAATPQMAPQQQLPAGAFVAPPQSGSVVSQQSSVGIRGLRLRFPALTLELPTIEMPNIFRRGRAAHMDLDGATANYVAGAGINPVATMPMASFATYSQPNAARLQPASNAPEVAPAATVQPPQAQPNDQLQCEYDDLKRRFERLEQMVLHLQQIPVPAQMLPSNTQCDQLPICPPPHANNPAQPQIYQPNSYHGSN